MFGILGFNAAMGKRQKQVQGFNEAMGKRQKQVQGFSEAMGKRQKQVQGYSRPSSPPRENSKDLPVDLLIDIFSRLSLGDVARSRCVSKLWFCVLRRPEFTKLFLKISSARPRILITFQHNGRRIFYSIPQGLDPNRNYSSPISPYHHMDFPNGSGYTKEFCPPIRGFICSKSKKPLICNPSTGEHISLPIPATNKNDIRSYFGFDPIDNLFKVLCVSDDYVCRVSTVGTGEVTWRTVECSVPHRPLYTEICIDGILYYLAKCKGSGFPTPYMIVCFDVRFQSFKFLALAINTDELWSSALVNYQGKLGVLWAGSCRIHCRTEHIELHVLEDADEAKWSKTIYNLPYYWKNVAAGTNLKFVGMTSAGEIVFSTYILRGPFYIFYFNTVKNSAVRVEVEFKGVVVEACWPKIVAFLNHVENVEIMD